MLRFESAHYYTMVWLNSKMIVEHDGGHLPFEADISSTSGLALLVVAVNVSPIMVVPFLTCQRTP